MHLSGDRRHSAIRELARLESEFGDLVEGVELLLSLRNEDLFVEEFDWLYAQSSRVDLLQTFAKVLESLQSTQAEMLCLNLRLSLKPALHRMCSNELQMPLGPKGLLSVLLMALAKIRWFSMRRRAR